MANFRQHITSSGKQVLAGRSAETNEMLIEQVGKGEIVLHTLRPGSPFVNIKADKKDVTIKEIREAAVFCAAYSQSWKKPKKKPEKIEVDYFLGEDIFKLEGMKTGTFGVKKHKTIVAKKEDVEEFEKGK